MRKIIALVKKELIQLRRDRRLLPVVIMAPILQLLILGYAVNLDVRHIPVVLVDLDNSQSSRQVTAAVMNSGYFRTTARAYSQEEGGYYLDRGQAAVVLVIPRGFEADLVAGRETALQALVDGTESQTASIAINYLEMITRQYNQRLILERVEKSGLGLKPVIIQAEFRAFFNPSLSSRKFFLPGIFGLLVMVMTVMLTAMAVVRESDTGTMEQLIVTPLKPVEIITGKLLSFFLVGLVDIALILGVIYFWFRLPLKGDFFLFLLLSVLYMLNTLGLGLFISTITRTPQQAMLTSFFFMMPMILLSGFVFPVENMPRFFQWITCLIPLRYYLVVLRGMFLKGVGIKALADEGLMLLVLALVLNLLSVSRFRRRLD
ncbi:MAG: ABC transporter permease [Candidatus Saccharicenans sp.]|jgi:ABC-2 type transport system permease protein|nr:ABC transporter permease [Candidatus Saccharicenans sp.]HOE14754.1 ABC transporter permease [Candidatus Saccharicenans sp.]HOJ27074.1 ABC transporter permease [Candidatus Saccharicenans sp.]HOL46335.1 ABC transporter permease [Candidatus Saccharicenans sp.]HOM93978.1 ABC transporter permease [Candidatus Saccharicenans sp.]